MYRANYPVDNPADYWNISLCLVFLDHLVEETTLLNDKQDTETQYNKTCHKRFIGHETKENMT
jgi:hypothetical protein